MDRPIECSQCKKPVKVVYKEIVNKTITTTGMCADCPVLQQKLHGEGVISSEKEFAGETGLCCGSCMTTYRSVKTGNPVGCSECYNVFCDLLTQQLVEAGSIPPRIKKNVTMKRSLPIHVGKSPEKTSSIGVSSRITSLNAALNVALKQENYEQAASIRDQIKSLTNRPDEGKKR